MDIATNVNFNYCHVMSCDTGRRSSFSARHFRSSDYYYYSLKMLLIIMNGFI